MASGAVEKTAEDLRKEIQELHRQQREVFALPFFSSPLLPTPLSGCLSSRFVSCKTLISLWPQITERLRDPRGIRRGGVAPRGARLAAAAGGPLNRGIVRPVRSSVEVHYLLLVDFYWLNLFYRFQAVESDDQPPPKRRLSSAVVKLEDGEVKEDVGATKDAKEEDPLAEASAAASGERNEQKTSYSQSNGGGFRRDGNSRLRKTAEEKVREESERLRQQEREQIAEKRKRDLVFLEWKTTRRAELSEYQRLMEEQYLSNVEQQLERWHNARNARKTDNLVNLQETMDRELETHKLEHGPKTRRIPGGNDDEEDVEDIAAEDELMDEVLEVHERIDGDTPKPSDIGNGS
ncbi:hypothetical protein B296_00032506 [Ensete ventricosum]|uniref:Pinin/SDK/MemA protein domain-containing protein n=1 Tax=Ensete ventricosum TaxID=4639 RepID=A0A427A296_ENSVE|nr:hypothetical protein B296_00032506 [Ensete ventricosum]